MNGDSPSPNRRRVPSVSSSSKSSIILRYVISAIVLLLLTMAPGCEGWNSLSLSSPVLGLSSSASRPKSSATSMTTFRVATTKATSNTSRMSTSLSARTPVPHDRSRQFSRLGGLSRTSLRKPSNRRLSSAATKCFLESVSTSGGGNSSLLRSNATASNIGDGTSVLWLVPGKEEEDDDDDDCHVGSSNANVNNSKNDQNLKQGMVNLDRGLTNGSNTPDGRLQAPNKPQSNGDDDGEEEQNGFTTTDAATIVGTTSFVANDTGFRRYPPLEMEDQCTSSNNNTKKLSVEIPSAKQEHANGHNNHSVDNKDMITASPTPSGDVMKARLLLIGAAALYGTNFALVKLMGESPDLPIGLSTTLRFGLAALATSPWLFLGWNNHQQQQSDSMAAVTSSTASDIAAESATALSTATFLPTGVMHPWDSPSFGAAVAGFEVGLWNSIAYIAQAIGLETTLASTSAFLCAMSVVVVPLLDFAILKKKLFPKQITGVLLAIVGVACLELGGGGGQNANGVALEWYRIAPGDLISMIQPFAFGMAFWRMEAGMRKYPDQANRVTAAQLLAVFCAALIFSSFLDPAARSGSVMTVQEHLDQLLRCLSNPTVAFSLVWTGLVTTALTIYMETLALKTLSAAETTLIFSTEPVSGAAFAALVLGERFGPNAIIGSFLILSGCLFSNLGKEGFQNIFQRITGQSHSNKNADQSSAEN